LSFEKTSNIDEPLSKLIKRREKTQINKIRGEKGNITTNTNEIQRIMREHSKKLENLEEMDEFLDAFDLPILIQEDITHFKRYNKQ
jgi:hypothetical protein